MATDKIKDKLLAFNSQFKLNSGHFKSFEVIFYYINFLETEPYLKKLLAPLSTYANEQLDLIFETAQNPEKSKAYENIKLDILNPTNFSQEPIFNKEFIGWQKSLENKERVNFMSMLPVNLACLTLVADMMWKIKDCQKEGDIERANEIIKVIQEESFSVMPAHNIKNFPPVPMLSNQFLDISMELLNKYIIDKIDGKEFLTNKKTNSNQELIDWQAIEIKFIDEYGVVIKNQSDCYRSDYEKMGFADKRKDSHQEAKARKSWDLLRLFAIKNNVFPLGQLNKAEKAKFKKQKQELSKLLKLYFKAKNDPIIHDKVNNEYRINIKLTPDVTFRDQWLDRKIIDKEYL